MCWLQLSAQLWHYPTFLLPPLMAIACIECFAGYRAWRFLIGLNGGALGFVAGTVLCVLLDVPMLVLVGAFGGAFAGVLLFAWVLPLGSFVVVLGSLTSLVIVLGRMAGFPPHYVMPLAVLAGLVGAVAAIGVCRPVVTIVAAIAGAQQIASAWCAYYCLPSDRIPLPDVVDPTEWTAFITLATIGMLVQFATPPRVRTDQPGRGKADIPQMAKS